MSEKTVKCTCVRPAPRVGPASCPTCGDATAELRGDFGLQVVCPVCEPAWLVVLPHDRECPAQPLRGRYCPGKDTLEKT